MSVVKRNAKVDTEKVLYDHLFPKYGERFLEYRKKYENYLKDSEHKYLPDYPISVILTKIIIPIKHKCLNRRKHNQCSASSILTKMKVYIQ